MFHWLSLNEWGKIKRSCLLAIEGANENIYKSVRNVPKVDVLPVEQLNAGDICNHQKLLFTKEALLSVLNKEKSEMK